MAVESKGTDSLCDDAFEIFKDNEDIEEWLSDILWASHKPGKGVELEILSQAQQRLAEEYGLCTTPFLVGCRTGRYDPDLYSVKEAFTYLQWMRDNGAGYVIVPCVVSYCWGRRLHATALIVDLNLKRRAKATYWNPTRSSIRFQNAAVQKHYLPRFVRDLVRELDPSTRSVRALCGDQRAREHTCGPNLMRFELSFCREVSAGAQDPLLFSPSHYYTGLTYAL